jgi:hypothetical protein
VIVHIWPIKILHSGAGPETFARTSRSAWRRGPRSPKLLGVLV